MADIQTGARGEGVQKARKNGEQGQPDASVSYNISYHVCHEFEPVRYVTAAV